MSFKKAAHTINCNNNYFINSFLRQHIKVINVIIIIFYKFVPISSLIITLLSSFS